MQRVYSPFLTEVLPLISFGIGPRFFGRNHGPGSTREASKTHSERTFHSKIEGFQGRIRDLCCSHISSPHLRVTDQECQSGVFPRIASSSISRTLSGNTPSSGLGSISTKPALICRYRGSNRCICWSDQWAVRVIKRVAHQTTDPKINILAITPAW